jgi:3-oxoacyl-[acyl-carrier-protein] synthase I
VRPVILRVGLCSPLGLSTAATQRAAVAGLAAFSDTLVEDEEGRPLRASHFAALAGDTTRTERLIFFAERALQNCIDALEPRHIPPIKAFVALPAGDVSRPLRADDVMSALQRRGPGFAIDWSERPVVAGPAGFLHALHAACDSISAGATSLALVGGVDSNCDRASLRALVRSRRALTRNNPDGAIPGEGAGFLLVARAPTAGLAPLARVVASAIAKDSASLGPVFTQLYAACGGVRPDHLFACQRPDRAASRALIEAYFRAPRLMPEPFRMSLSAEALGDAGVGAAAVETGITLHRFAISSRRPEPLRAALICAPGDGGRAAGAVVSAA